MRTLLSRKLTMMAHDALNERLEHLTPDEKFFVDLIDRYKPNEDIEYLNSRREEDSCIGAITNKTGTVQLSQGVGNFTEQINANKKTN